MNNLPNKKTILPLTENAWITLRGNKPQTETLYWINYMLSNTVRMGFWREHGPWGSGFYCVTELLTPECLERQTFRVEPAMYVTPEQYQLVKGLHQIEMIDKL